MTGLDNVTNCDAENTITKFHPLCKVCFARFPQRNSWERNITVGTNTNLGDQQAKRDHFLFNTVPPGHSDSVKKARAVILSSVFCLFFVLVATFFFLSKQKIQHRAAQLVKFLKEWMLSNQCACSFCFLNSLLGL